MSLIARCKFIVDSVTHHGYGGRTVKLNTHYDNTIPEDRAFTKATPTGSMEVRIDNTGVFDVFQPGKYVYVDVTAVDQKPVGD